MKKHKQIQMQVEKLFYRLRTAAATKLDNVLDNMFEKWKRRQNMSMNKNQGSKLIHKLRI